MHVISYFNVSQTELLQSHQIQEGFRLSDQIYK
jgi:hypothetical protein